MGTLLLNSLEIRNFRGFHHLQIERLGRVNLIVGKNNVGKSSLLEALQLYAYRGLPDLIWDILGTRDELRVSLRVAGIEDLLSALKYLFYGRLDLRSHFETIQIGPVNSVDETLSVAMGWSTVQVDEKGSRNVRPILREEFNMVNNLVPRLTFQMGKRWGANYSLDTSIPYRLLKPELNEICCIFIAANGLDRGRVGELWDGIALTSLEKDVLTSLSIIAPGVEGLNLVGDPESTHGRVPIVKIRDIDEPLPLRSLGNGMQRMLGIALALANAKDGILLIDEIENGIHYSVQSELWQLIFQLARRLNVQVFATTHSWDCIEGFQKAAQEKKQEDGMLIRLSLRKDEVVATLFDERKLGIATREQIEVR